MENSYDRNRSVPKFNKKKIKVAGKSAKTKELISDESEKSKKQASKQRILLVLDWLAAGDLVRVAVNRAV